VLRTLKGRSNINITASKALDRHIPYKHSRHAELLRNIIFSLLSLKAFPFLSQIYWQPY